MPIYHNWGYPRLGSRTGQNVANDLVGVRSRLLVVQYGISVNTTSTDTAIPLVVIPGGFTGTPYYILRGVLVTNATATLAAGPTFSIYTGAGATGSQLVNGQALTTLTTSSLYLDATLTATATSNVLNATTLYFRTGGANAVNATVDVFFYGEVLP